jgi:hypothetical protein
VFYIRLRLRLGHGLYLRLRLRLGHGFYIRLRLRFGHRLYLGLRFRLGHGLYLRLGYGFGHGLYLRFRHGFGHGLGSLQYNSASRLVLRSRLCDWHGGDFFLNRLDWEGYRLGLRLLRSRFGSRRRHIW